MSIVLPEDLKKYPIWEPHFIKIIFHYFHLGYGNLWSDRFKENDLFFYSISQETNQEDIFKIWEESLSNMTPGCNEVSQKDLIEFLQFTIQEFEFPPTPRQFCKYFTEQWIGAFFDGDTIVIEKKETLNKK